MKQLFCILFVLNSMVSFAQIDSLNNGKSVKDSLMYTHLKNKMAKHPFTDKVYHFLFRDVYNQAPKSGEVKAILINPFLPYQDKIIGNITIKTLDVFGPTIYDTTRQGNGIERFVSHTLHSNTRQDIIKKSYLLFKEGDKLDPKILEDNERIIRNNPTIHDARIVVVERADAKWLVDIQIIIQDIWSINVDVSFENFNNFALSIEDANYLGRGHSFKNYFHLDKNDPYQHVQFSSRYTIPYYKKTFITGQAEFLWERDLHRQAVRLYRPFLTTEMKYAGALEVGHSGVRENKRLIINNSDDLYVYNVNFFYYDTWLGRSFKIPKNDRMNARIIVAARVSGYNFIERPFVSADTNKLYWNRQTNLFSIGYSDRNYRRDLLIYGFGRTEDVPIGTLLSVTGGYENTEFGQRGYGGVQYARGYYLHNNNGYFYGLFNFGSFIKNSKLQQGVLNAEANYISPLLRFQKHHFRHFLTLKYTYGIDRDNLEYLNISNREGITGINSDFLRGDKRLTFGLETVMFSPKSIVGFRVASFVFANFGLVTLQGIPLVKSPVYEAFGLGFRLRNENLTFNTFQIRLGYYPNIPNLSSPFRYGLDGVQPLRLRDFDITAPSVVPLR